MAPVAGPASGPCPISWTCTSKWSCIHPKTTHAPPATALRKYDDDGKGRNWSVSHGYGFGARRSRSSVSANLAHALAPTWHVCLGLTQKGAMSRTGQLILGVFMVF